MASDIICPYNGQNHVKSMFSIPYGFTCKIHAYGTSRDTQWTQFLNKFSNCSLSEYRNGK
ncbi:hypothetical protein CHS0354_031956, partial [Potamilus streckersoni]